MGKKKTPLSAMLILVLVSSMGRAEDRCETLASLEGYESSTKCKSCHPTQYDTWSKSMHARGAVDSVFTAALNGTSGKDSKGRTWCLGCHAPTVLATKDFGLEKELTREGITCDFCHTVVAVHAGRTRNEFEIKVGREKFGSERDSGPSEGRVFKFSDLHGKSWFCAGCHELKAENGTSILGTYSEWKESPYAERGVRCQDCHMSGNTGLPVVASHVRDTAHEATGHDFMGGHSPLKRKKAVSLDLKAREGESGAVVAEVTLVNRESGHRVPTGTPTRRLVLTVDLLDGKGKVVQSREKSFRKVLVNGEGREVRDAVTIFSNEVKIASDNRLPPLTPVVDTFEFTPTGGRWAVHARLEYEMESDSPGREWERFLMAEDRFEPPLGFPFAYILGFLFLGVLTLGAVIYAVVTKPPRPADEVGDA